jgi:two-component system, chemotaxis family, response regulator PixG
MNPDAINSDQLGQLKYLSETGFTGILTIQAAIAKWSILFYQGNIGWAIDSIFPHRSWQRQLLRHLPNTTLEQLAAISQSLQAPPEIQPELSWPYLALVQLHLDGQIDRQKLEILITDAAQDVFFDVLQIGHHKPLTYHHDSIYLSQPPAIVFPLEKLIITPLEEWQEWQTHHLTDIAPDYIPVIDYPTALYQQTNTAIYNSLQKIFAPPPGAQNIDQHYSLREIAIRQQQDLLLLTRSLLHHLQQKTVSLHPPFQDLPQPIIERLRPLLMLEETKVGEEVKLAVQVTSPPVFSVPVNLSGIVAYIDDNAQANQHMADMITSIGYQFLGIKDPSDAVNIMHQQQPNLIIMEAAMPLASGRQICQQIRRSGNLAKVPIVLIVDQENLAERLLAKLAGAASTITHPLDGDKIKKLIQRYLGNLPSIEHNN